MANYDELFDMVLESSRDDNLQFIGDLKTDIKNIKKDIKEMKKSKDVDAMIECSKKLDKIIDEIDKYRKTEVNYDNYENIDKTIRTLKAVSTVFSALTIAIPVGILTKGTIDGIKGFKNCTLANEEDMKNLKEVKGVSPDNNIGVAVASTAAAAAGSAASLIMQQDREKIKGSFNNVMKDLETAIKTLKKLNANLKKDIMKYGKGTNESVDELKLTIFESCHAGEITEEERDNLLNFL